MFTTREDISLPTHGYSGRVHARPCDCASTMPSALGMLTVTLSHPPTSPRAPFLTMTASCGWSHG
eukprot:4460345-Pleurochrysis_carterae.AAC.1